MNLSIRWRSRFRLIAACTRYLSAQVCPDLLRFPTGWDITLDLIRKLAAASGESAEPDPEEWYREKYEEAPDYSKLIGALARTRAERQQLLRPYFEPNAQEREEGIKQPTAAHEAIAKLVAQGFVKVIITTNFDRLIEKALEEEGVAPGGLNFSRSGQGLWSRSFIRSIV